MILPTPGIDFGPWIVPGPNGKSAISSEAPDHIKQAWAEWMGELEQGYQEGLFL